MSRESTRAVDLNKRAIRLSYAVASLYLIAALGGVAYSIYALIALKKTAFTYTTIVIACIVVVAVIIQFFVIHNTEKAQTSSPVWLCGIEMSLICL